MTKHDRNDAAHELRFILSDSRIRGMGASLSSQTGNTLARRLGAALDALPNEFEGDPSTTLANRLRAVADALDPAR